MRDGFENEARIFKPQAAQQSAGRPLVVLVYGGGFITGDNNSPTPYAKPIAHLYDAIVVSISYRMTPEFKFPVQAHDVWDNLQWIAKNASRIGADPSAGFVLGGESAGGNVAAVAAAMAQTDRLELPLTGLWLSVPWLLNEAPKGYEEFYQAREQNANAAMINNEVLSMVKRMWCPDFASKNFSPFNNLDVIDDEHPTTYIQVCGLDPLRDDGLIYGRVLDERGVKTKFDLYPGVPHAHWAMFPSIEASKKGMVDAVINIGWLLGKQVEREDIHESLGKLA
ncbi:hypothetical protein AAFC00_002432 [Neodothiora populina]|uniref:Alpha/beta hydrolase fold-3 domain-containing protein n=1 Tax=Neodothiora populina TaxID=2781224 RepID=A0ABR3P722_9PEZI